jgi:hypothetical protein
MDDFFSGNFYTYPELLRAISFDFFEKNLQKKLRRKLDKFSFHPSHFFIVNILGNIPRILFAHIIH